MKKFSIYKIITGAVLGVCAVVCGVVGITLPRLSNKPQAYAAETKSSISIDSSLSNFYFSSDGESIYPYLNVKVSSDIANDFGEKSLVSSEYKVTKWRDPLTNKIVNSKPSGLFPGHSPEEYEREKTFRCFLIARVKTASEFSNFSSLSYPDVGGFIIKQHIFYNEDVPVNSMQNGYTYRWRDETFSEKDDTDYLYFFCIVKGWQQETFKSTFSSASWIITSSNATVELVSDNYVKLNPTTFAKEQLKNSSFDGDNNLTAKRLNLSWKLSGYTVPTSNTAVEVRYKIADENSGCVRDVYSVYGNSVAINPLHAYSKTYAWDKWLIAKNITDGLNYFNVSVEKKGYDVNDSNSSWSLWERPLLTATGYSYEYNPTTNKSIITIEYEPYQASSFVIQIQSQSSQQTILYLQSTNIKKINGKTTIRFYTDRIKTMLSNNMNWTVLDSNFDNFEITNPYSYSGEVTIKKEKTGNKVTALVVETTNPDLLQYCAVYLPVSENGSVDLAVGLKYKVLSFDTTTDKIKIEDKTIILDKKISSVDFQKLNAYSVLEGTSLMGENGGFRSVIESAIHPAFLNGVEFLSVDETSIKKEAFEDNETAIITILYKTTPLFSIRDESYSGGNKTTYPRFKIVSSTTTSYSGNYFAGTYAGERVTDITCGISDLMNETKSGDKIADWQFSFNMEYPADNLIPIVVTYSDTLKLNIEYLENYYYLDSHGNKQLSGFAKRTNFYADEKSEKPVSAAAFADIYKPTIAELESVLGKTSGGLIVIGDFGTVDDKNVKVEFDNENACYYIKLAYNKTTLKQILSNGNSNLYNVPLTCFFDWKQAFNSDWSIQVLNTAEKYVFKSQGDIKEQDLYGYFYTSVFSEKATDINSLFSSYSGGGCRAFYEMKEFKGSELYKFCRKNPLFFSVSGAGVGAIAGLIVGHPVIGAAVGAGAGALIQYVAVSIEEFVSDAGTYYTYFLFIDGTNNGLNYTARNGAEDYFDDKSATEKAGEQLGNDIKNLLEGDSYLRKILVILGGTIVVLIFVSLVLKFLPVWQRLIAQIKENKAGRKDKKSE